MSYLKTVQAAGIITVFLSASQPAHAYLDPGTGSIIIQSVIGGIAAAVTFGAIYWSRFKVFLLRMLGKKPTDEGSDNK